MALTAGPAAPAGPGGPGSPRAPWGPSLPRAPWGPVSPWGGRGGRKSREREAALNPRGADSAPGGRAGGHGPGPARRGRPLSRQHQARGAARFLRFGPRGEPTRDSVRPPHLSTRPVPTSFSQLKRRHPGWDSQAGPTLAPAAPGKPGGPAGPVGPWVGDRTRVGGTPPHRWCRGFPAPVELNGMSPGGTGAGAGVSRWVGGYLRGDQQRREHRRYRERPAGGRHPLAVPMAAEEPPAPRAGRPSLPNPGTHSRAGGTGTASLTGKTTRTLGGEEDTSVTKGDSLPFWGLLPPMCPPAPQSILQ